MSMFGSEKEWLKNTFKQHLQHSTLPDTEAVFRLVSWTVGLLSVALQHQNNPWHGFGLSQQGLVNN